MTALKELIIRGLSNGEKVWQEHLAAQALGSSIALDSGRVARKIEQYHPEQMSLRLIYAEHYGCNARCLRFVRTDGVLPVFEAGQYLNIFTEIEGVRSSRPYSISSSPKQRSYYEIIVARVEAGFVSDYLLDQVQVGQCFDCSGPAGVFHYNPVFHKRRSVFLAGGSGITPFLSMSREILESGQDREVFLLYGSRTEESALCHSELSYLAERYSNFHYHLVLSAAEQSRYRQGFLDAACLRELIPDYQNCTYYICGPQIMNEFCSQALATLGLPLGQQRREMFGTRQDIVNEPGWPSAVSSTAMFQVKVGERSFPARAGESLLVALERAGVRVNVCCRSGECSLCRVRLVSGKVFTARGALLRHADEKFGYIHSCKAYPLADCELQL